MKKFYREYTLPKIEFIKFQLDQIINFKNNILNQTEITVLAYVYLYGVNAQNKILEDRILTNVNSIINYISRLNIQGYIIKERLQEELIEEGDKKPGKKPYTSLKLNSQITIVEEDYIQISNVKLDTDSDQVYHPNFRK